MKVLVVTGRLAEEMVRDSAKGADVLVLNVDVAAFITPQMLLEAAPEGYDLILIPGAITADFGPAEQKLGTKIRLGPKHAVDLRYIMSLLDEVTLSRKIPACTLLEGRMREEAQTKIEELEQLAVPVLTIKDLKIGGKSRIKVLAEIVDATRFDEAKLQAKISRYEAQGADMIDLGIPLDAKSEDVKRAVSYAKNATNLPVSVDTLDPDLLEAGIEAGADLILSLNQANARQIGPLAAKAGIPAVVIPGPGSTHPPDPCTDFDSRPDSESGSGTKSNPGPCLEPRSKPDESYHKAGIEENVLLAQSFGVEVMADPVLNPPLQGLVKSAYEYQEFHRAHPGIPLFFGVGNVTELIDADSPGVNALLTAMGAEVGASVLFTPEYSDKAKGSIHELKTASNMMILAQDRKSPPKDLGVDLLILKEKRRLPENATPQDFVEASDGYQWEMDPEGCFRIGTFEGKIVAEHRKITIVGTSATEILNTIIDRSLVTRLDHAGYLGRELEKAEIALKLGRSYSQDESL